MANGASAAAGADDVDAQVDALMAMLGDDGAEALLAEMDPAFAAGTPTPAREIKARVAKVAAARPEFIAKIITYWLDEERRKGR